MDNNTVMIWASIVMAIAALVSAIIAICAVVAESRRARLSLSLDLISRLDEYFNGDHMTRLRQDVAKALLDKSYENVGDLLDFFETVGYMMNQGAIDEKMVWHEFYYWIHRVIQIAGDYIQDARKADPTIWEDVMKMYDKLRRIEMKERKIGVNHLSLSGAELQQYLVRESRLTERD